METIKVTNKAGIEFTIPVKDTRLRKLLESSTVYGAIAMKALKRLIPSPRTVVDVGANVGMSSVEFSTWAKKVVAFEPHKELYELARKNLNHLNNVVVMDYALGRNKDDSTFFSFSESSSLGAHIAVRPPKGLGQSVQVRPLDSFGLTKVDLIKIDVEGFEHDVLKGANNVLQMQKPVLLVEIVPDFLKRYRTSPEELLQYLGSLGYLQFDTKLQQLEGWTEIPRMRDRIFVHRLNKRLQQLGRRGFFY